MFDSLIALFNSLSFKNSLKSTFSYGKVYTTDLNPKLSAACHVADGFFKVGRVTELNYIDSLLEICLNHEIKLVVPTIDTELLVLAKNKNRFKEKGIELVISDESLVKACRDKRETAKLYEDIGIPSPKIYPLDKIEYPAFCKPYDGSSSIGAFPILNEKMLTEEIKKNPKNIYMELVGKEFVEYTVDAYFDKRNLGLEPFDPKLNVEYLKGKLKNRTLAVKALLLDQTVITGIGNIYADEILYRTKIHPQSSVKRLKTKDLENIILETQAVLEKAIDEGGTTIRSYTSSLGVSGRFQVSLQAYGRFNQPCLRCGAFMEKVKVAQRTSVFCPTCQRVRQ